MLEITDLTYASQNQVILADINLTIEAGKIYGLLGANGAGKTTLLQLIAGFLTANDGQITVDGSVKRRTLLEHVAYMNNEFYLPKSWTIERVVRFYEQSAARFSYEIAGRMIVSLEIDMTKKMKDLSRGEKERVLLMLTLSQKAKLYLLDEPLTGIDMITREEIIRNLLTFTEENATIIIATHYIEIFELLFDEALFLKDGGVMDQVDCENLREEQQLTLSEYYVKTHRGRKRIW
ncbi:MAG: ATP-binding cassette domain-containing protein [Culicoidibacterales bacterium]